MAGRRISRASDNLTKKAAPVKGRQGGPMSALRAWRGTTRASRRGQGRGGSRRRVKASRLQRGDADIPWFVSGAASSFETSGQASDWFVPICKRLTLVEVFHNICYAIIVCGRKVKVSCFCKVGMSHSPGLIGIWEIADGIDYDERARPAKNRGAVQSRGWPHEHCCSGPCTGDQHAPRPKVGRSN